MTKWHVIYFNYFVFLLADRDKESLQLPVSELLDQLPRILWFISFILFSKTLDILVCFHYSFQIFKNMTGFVMNLERAEFTAHLIVIKHRRPGHIPHHTHRK